VRRAENLRLLVVIAQRTGLAGGELLAGLSTECCTTLDVAARGPGRRTST